VAQASKYEEVYLKACDTASEARAWRSAAATDLVAENMARQ
jgi:hypothetical protein